MAKRILSATWGEHSTTRSTDRPYTHAAATRYSDGQIGFSFHLSAAGAAKGTLTAGQRAGGCAVLAVVPVVDVTPARKRSTTAATE